MPRRPAAPSARARRPDSQRLYENAYELGVRYQLTPAAAVMAKTARSYRFANVDEIYETSPRVHATSSSSCGRRPRARTRSASSSRRARIRRARDGLRDRRRRRDPPRSVHDRRRQHEPAAVAPAWARARSERAAARAARAGRGVQLYRGEVPRRRARRQSVHRCRTSTSPGKAVPLVPRHKVSLRASWDFTPATRLTALLSLRRRAVHGQRRAEQPRA